MGSALWLALALLWSTFCVAAPKHLQAAELRMQAAATQAGVAWPLPQPEIRIYKAPRRLELWSDGVCIKRYDVGLGHRGLEDKRRQGDHLTPEGTFYICSRNEKSQFHLFLGLSYPHETAVERGWKEGLITKPKRDALLKTLRRKGTPDWNTRLGGAVGIHGGGSGADWTWGCIAVEDDEVEELWMCCPVGTPVRIERA